MQNVTLLVVGQDPSDGQQLIRLKRRLEDKCRQWQVTVIETRSFEEARRLLIKHKDIEVVQFVNEADFFKSDIEAGGNLVAGEMKVHPANPLACAKGNLLRDTLRPEFSKHGLPLEIGSLDDVAERRHREKNPTRAFAVVRG